MRDSMPTCPLVTIAIPTYNRAETYLPQALHSALKQTYSNIEILVADNCSTDNTEKVVKEFHDPRIKYVKHLENIGHYRNTIFCVNEACGEFILMLHDDDLIDYDLIEICLKSIYDTSSDIGIIRVGTRWINSEGDLLKELPNRAEGWALDVFFRSIILGRTGMYLCSTLFNTKRLREIGGFNSKHWLFYDVMAGVKLAAKYGRHDICEVKASNRKHPAEITFASTAKNWCEESLELIDLMCELAQDNKDLVKAEGMRGMTAYNYHLTGKIQSPLKRICTYWMVYRNFGYTYSPVSFFYNKMRGAFINWGKEKIKSLF